MRYLAGLSLIGLLLVGSGVCAQQGQPPQPTPQERVAMLKQWLQASQAQLRNYEWIETTAISKDGEEKKRQQARCYYGVDGKLQRVPVAESESESGGLPGVLPPGKLLKAAAAHKKKEMGEYVERLVELVHAYLPPDQARIQQAVDAGKFAANPVEPGKRVRLEFRDYLKAGDVLGVEIELPTNRLLGMQVSSYLDSPEDPVALDVAMGLMPDGTIYMARTTLDAKAKATKVVVENTGHHKTTGG